MNADTATAIDGRYVVLPGQTPEGGEILSVLLKRTYAIEHCRECARAGEDQPITSGEVFWDTPMNSTVRFTIAESGEEFRLTLVYPKDVGGEHERISVLAPVGSALLGLHRV